MPGPVVDEPDAYEDNESPPPEPPLAEDFSENVFDQLKNVTRPVYQGSKYFTNPPTLGEIILAVLDVATKHKQTDGEQEDVWAMLRIMLPGDENMDSFNVVATLLKAHMNNSLKVVHTCVNDCIAYFNCASEQLQTYRHAHRTYCPTCGEARYLEGSDKLPRKVFYYMPMGYVSVSLSFHFCLTFV